MKADNVPGPSSLGGMKTEMETTTKMMTWRKICDRNTISHSHLYLFSEPTYIYISNIYSIDGFSLRVTSALGVAR